MVRKTSHYLLPFILVGYAFLYMATKKNYCDEDCLKMDKVEGELKERPYVFDAFIVNGKTVFVRVEPSVPHNWQGLGDTACSMVKEMGLPQRTVMIVTYKPPLDTLAVSNCP